MAHVTPNSGFCILFGYNMPFDHDRLASLYKNHGQYVSRVAIASEQLVRQRLWLQADAITVIRRAAHADVP